jgi:hypothetical protein
LDFETDWLFLLTATTELLMKRFNCRAMKLRKEYFLFFIIVLFSLNLLAQPTITSFSPASGPVGTTVTINGSNFSSTPANNIVFFGQ